MKGKARFTQEEIDKISVLIEKKLKASKEDQKKIRDEIRALGFYARDFGIGGGYMEIPRKLTTSFRVKLTT